MTPTVIGESQESARGLALARVRILAGFFGLCAVGTGIQTVIDIAARFFPPLGRHSPGSNSLAPALGGLVTLGLLRTYQLLAQRRRAGALVATVSLAGWIIESLRVGGPRWDVAFLSALGLAIVAAAWRYLE